MERPFFVYGTLKPGFANYARYLRGRTSSEIPAELPAAALYSDGRLPFVTMSAPLALPSDRVSGYLIGVPPGIYAEVLAELDALEGYHRPRALSNWYERVVVQVESAAGSQTAFVYLAGARIIARMHRGQLHKHAEGRW